MVKEMTTADSTPEFPDEVPVPDAVEQSRPAIDSDDPPLAGADDAAPLERPFSERPLESDESDWQEQRVIVDGFDEDEFR